MKLLVPELGQWPFFLLQALFRAFCYKPLLLRSQKRSAGDGATSRLIADRVLA